MIMINQVIQIGTLSKHSFLSRASMKICNRQTRIAALSSFKSLVPAPHGLIHTYGKQNIKFPTVSHNHSFGAKGNLGIAPKTMSPIQNLTLNDGNEIPLVRRSHVSY